MCGILFVSQNKNIITRSNFLRILKSQKWRGPDNTSFKSLNKNKILLGHNRLSILDKKPRSNQPMESEDGRYLLIFDYLYYGVNLVLYLVDLIAEYRQNLEYMSLHS